MLCLWRNIFIIYILLKENVMEYYLFIDWSCTLAYTIWLLLEMLLFFNVRYLKHHCIAPSNLSNAYVQLILRLTGNMQWIGRKGCDSRKNQSSGQNCNVSQCGNVNRDLSVQHVRGGNQVADYVIKVVRTENCNKQCRMQLTLIPLLNI